MIPTAVLRERATIRPYQGTTGTGAPAFGPPLTRVPCRLVGKRRAVRTRDGVDVIADAVVQIRPGYDIVAESTVEIRGRTYTVLVVSDAEELARPHHTDLIVEGPRT
jgi:hypothetical protein